MYTAPALQETPAQRAAFYTAKAHAFAQLAQASLTEAGRAYNSEQAAKYLRFAAFASSQSAPVEAMPEVPAPIEAPRAPNAVDLAAIEAMRERGRQQRAAEKANSQPTRTDADACRVRVMRRFWAICKAHGLDVRNAEAMTVALAGYLGCIIPSRACLSSGQWCEAAEAVELGLLAW